jgi:hypothetical protein
MWDIAKKLLRLKTTSVEERRREIREQRTDGDAYVDGRKYPLNNWSASGFAVGPCNLTPPLGTRLEIEFHVPLSEQILIFKTLCLVVRHVKDEGLFAGMFSSLDDDTRKSIDEYFEVLTADSLREEVEDGLRDAAGRLKRKK